MIHNWDFGEIIKQKEKLCSTSRITEIFGWLVLNFSPQRCTFEAPSNMKIYVIDLWGPICLMCSSNLVHIKFPSFLSPSAKCTWQPTSYNATTGSFPPETKMFNSWILKLVTTSPTNINPKIPDSFLIQTKFLSMFWPWISSIKSLDISFLFGGW